jgi:nucleoside-diphosphate-sugar epimerase
MQTILGSGGAIGNDLAKELRQFTDSIRLVSRNPKKVNETDTLMPIDVFDLSKIDTTIEGSEVVYVTIGFEYKTKVWKQIWVPFIQQVIISCKKHKAKLVFFDNVYMYAKAAIPFMTENSPLNPPSVKGGIRKQVRDMIMNEVNSGSLTALIARSADFYGPRNKNSALSIMVVQNLFKGKKAQAFGDINKIHTYTYTPDAAKATALLGNTPEAFGQVWHLPTTKERLTNRQWIELIAKELNTEPKVQTVSNFMLKIIGIFVPIMREFPEMMYQYEQDYIFDSSKFEKRFGISATSPQEGVRAMISELRK